MKRIIGIALVAVSSFVMAPVASADEVIESSDVVTITADGDIYIDNGTTFVSVGTLPIDDSIDGVWVETATVRVENATAITGSGLADSYEYKEVHVERENSQIDLPDFAVFCIWRPNDATSFSPCP